MAFSRTNRYPVDFKFGSEDGNGWFWELIPHTQARHGRASTKADLSRLIISAEFEYTIDG